MNLRSYRTMLVVLLCGVLMSSAAGQAQEKARADLSAPADEHKKLDVLAELVLSHVDFDVQSSSFSLRGRRRAT